MMLATLGLPSTPTTHSVASISYWAPVATMCLADQQTPSSSSVKQQEKKKLRVVTESHHLTLTDVKLAAEARDDWAEVDEAGTSYSDPILGNRGGSDDIDDESLCEAISTQDDSSITAGTKKSSSRGWGGGQRTKQAEDPDTIAEWRRQVSFRKKGPTAFCYTRPEQFSYPKCGDSVVDRLNPIDETKEQKEDEQQLGTSIRRLFCTYPCGCDTDKAVGDGQSIDGVVAFRQSFSYRIEPADMNKERYALVDADQAEADADEGNEESLLLSDPHSLAFGLLQDDHTAPTQQSDSLTDQLKNVKKKDEHSSFLDNMCDKICTLFFFKTRKHKSSDSSEVSLSDMTMPDDGGIFVVRNGATREVDLGEDIAVADDQLGKETSGRSYPGKVIEEKTKHAGDELVHTAKEAKMTLSGIASVVYQTMASKLSQNTAERTERVDDEAREKAEDLQRTADARKHAELVRAALAEFGGSGKNPADVAGKADSIPGAYEDEEGDDLYPSRASF